jgi:ABC-type antimicrobial peptide transport system permease subunit
VIVVSGVALGLLSSPGVARLLSSLLFGVPPYEPLALGGAAAVLLLTALLASWMPAARAARVDPMATLRAE